MLKSIQWKLVLISFLLVWLAMAIIGVYITDQMKKEQMNSMQATIISRMNYLADLLKDKMGGGGAPDIKNIVESWFNGQGLQVKFVKIYNTSLTVVQAGNIETSDNSISDYVFDKVMMEKRERIENENSSVYLKAIGFPIIDSNSNLVGVIYVSADLSEIKNNIKDIQKILTNATIWALCITVLLGTVLARTITDSIKEVTSKAEQLARGEYGQVITVKSNDEVGQLADMFNYLTVELKQTLDEMNNEKNKVDTIVTNMTDGIIAVNSDGKIIHTNPAVFNIFEINEEDLNNKNFDDIAAELQLGITTEDLFSDSEKNYNILSINNSVIKMSVVSYKNEKNEKSGAIIVLQDVTEQEKLDKMRKEFVANVSHELRTPLTTIKSYTETLLDGAMENKEYTINFLKVIDSESERMTRLVKDLLQLSKLDYDNIQWNMRKLNIVNIVSDCVYKMNISAKQKKQELSFEASAEIYEINGDKDRLEQVIVNIISNAIKYTPDNGWICVKVEKEDNNIIIKVIDNGMGIPKEDLPRLFERFYRVDKARSRMLGGTGLGLSIAKQIVEVHNGFIRIDSEYGDGTEVTIGFPEVFGNLQI